MLSALLDITWHRNVSKGGYGMVAQCRGWLPSDIGGVYWLYLDNQYMSTYVPIHAGVQSIHPGFQTYDPEQMDCEKSGPASRQGAIPSMVQTAVPVAPAPGYGGWL